MGRGRPRSPPLFRTFGTVGGTRTGRYTRPRGTWFVVVGPVLSLTSSRPPPTPTHPRVSDPSLQYSDRGRNSEGTSTSTGGRRFSTKSWKCASSSPTSPSVFAPGPRFAETSDVTRSGHGESSTSPSRPSTGWISRTNRKTTTTRQRTARTRRGTGPAGVCRWDYSSIFPKSNVRSSRHSPDDRGRPW